MKHTAVYMRVSTDSQNVQMQRDTVGTVLNEDELCRAVEYVDDGVSAIKLRLRDRPQAHQLIIDIADGKIERVIVYSRDRIARDSYEWIRFWRICRAFSVEVVFTMRGHAPFSDNPLTEMIYAQVGADEGKKIRERSRQAKYFSPQRLVGYEIRVKDNGEKEYILDPLTAPILSECFMRASSSNTLEEFLTVVAEHSLKLGISRERLIQGLQDERYVGTVLGRDGKPRFERIVEPSVFEQVTKLFAQFTNEVHHAIGTKLVVPRCGLCASCTPMEVNAKELTPDWVCRKHRSVSIPVDEVNTYVTDLVTQVVANMDPDKIRSLCVSEIEKAMNKLKKKPANIEYEIEHLALHLTFGPRRGRAYQEGLARLQQLGQELSELQTDIEELQIHRVDFQREIGALETLKHETALSDDSLSTLVEIILQEVVVYPHSVQMVVAQADIWEVDEQI